MRKSAWATTVLWDEMQKNSGVDGRGSGTAGHSPLVREGQPKDCFRKLPLYDNVL